MSNKKINICDRLILPKKCQCILWDLDGVIIDSLSHSISVCNTLLQNFFNNPNIILEDTYIRSIFAYDTATFWAMILKYIGEKYSIENTKQYFEQIHEKYLLLRKTTQFNINTGVMEILNYAKTISLKMVVVSNNPKIEIDNILKKLAINDFFDLVVGNDQEGLAKKPAPDTYLHAMKQMGLVESQCIIIEDSLIGAKAGISSNIYTIGVSTGGTNFNILSKETNACYSSFQKNVLAIKFGNVTKKSIITPNDFVSHMIEHIAWRLCLEINLKWYSNHWLLLGQKLGQEIHKNKSIAESAATLGMIDDGSAEVIINLDQKEGKLSIFSIENTDLDWFLSLRCEQIETAKPLLELMKGLALGLSANIQINICSVNDPHHTWEGVFRAIGIVLNKLFLPKEEILWQEPLKNITHNTDDKELKIVEANLNYCHVIRGTAESYVSIKVVTNTKHKNKYQFNVSNSIDMSSFYKLLDIFAKAAECSIEVDFNATVLNSSHVVMEDVALVLGKALLEIISLRMKIHGVIGAGSSIQSATDINTRPVHVGISVEGRKFWVFVPFNFSLETLKKQFLIGKNVYNSLRTEDLDDFIDGLSGGLCCSIIIHMHQLPDVELGWELIFKGLGESVKEILQPNKYRKGVPPGVKATLA